MFTDDQRFNITKNNYRQGINQLTIDGLRNEFKQGESFRDNYVYQHNNFLSHIYDPSEYFIRSFPDNPSVVSSYAFLMGIDYNNVEGIGLIQEKGAESPVSNQQIDDTRRALSIGRKRDGAKPIYVYSGNSDGFFFKDIASMYPGLQKDFDRNVDDAGKEYEYITDNRLFTIMSFAMNIPLEDINFKNLARYLDDYICAYSNNRNVSPFNFDSKTEEMISEYYVYLIKHGMLRDPALNKVLAHPFLYSLLREIMFKAQTLRDQDKWEGPCVTSKVSLAFGNRLTFLAALDVLNFDHDIVYNPGWGDQLTFELFEEDRELFVRIYINGELVTHLSRDGIIPLNNFIEYVCSRLYFGNMEKVKQGLEDYRQIAELTGGKCDSLTEVVPLFGCKMKEKYQFDQDTNKFYGWNEEVVRNNNRLTQIGNGRYNDNAIYFIQDLNLDSYDFDQSSNVHQHRSMGTERFDIRSMLANPYNRFNRR